MFETSLGQNNTKAGEEGTDSVVTKTAVPNTNYTDGTKCRKRRAERAQYQLSGHSGPGPTRPPPLPTSLNLPPPLWLCLDPENLRALLGFTTTYTPARERANTHIKKTHTHTVINALESPSALRTSFSETPDMPMLVLLWLESWVGKLRAVLHLCVRAQQSFGHLICCGRRVSRVIAFGWGSRVPTSQPENALPERLLAASVIAY